MNTRIQLSVALRVLRSAVALRVLRSAGALRVLRSAVALRVLRSAVALRVLRSAVALLCSSVLWIGSSACGSFKAPLDYEALPWIGTGTADSAASSCSDLSAQLQPYLELAGDQEVALSGGALTFYVRPSGDDANGGESPEQAFRTLERVNQQVLGPGQRVLLEGGFTYQGQLRLERDDSGRPDAPVTIGSFGAGRALIDAGEGTAIELASASSVVVRDLTLRGGWTAETQSGNAGFGIRAQNTLGGGRRLPLLRFTDLEISGFREAGIAIDARPSDLTKNSGYETVEIARCDVHDNGDVGIVTGGPYGPGPGYSHRGVLIHHVRAYRNRGIAHKGAHTGSGIILADVDVGAIERCVAHGNGEFNDHSAGGGFGIWTWDSNSIVIQHNESYGNQSQTADGGGFDLDGGVTHSVLQFNYSHDNHGAGFGAFQFAYARPHGANLIRYNVSQNDGAGVLLWDNQSDLSGLAVHNNVFYGARPLVTYSGFTSVQLLHNIFYTTGPTLLDVADGDGLTLQANAYFSGDAPFHVIWNSARSPAEYGSFDAFRAGTGHERHGDVVTGIHADPRLSNPGGGPTLGDAEQLHQLDAYRLEHDSPLIERGVDLGAYDIDPGCLDFFGNTIPRGDALDIGAEEVR